MALHPIFTNYVDSSNPVKGNIRTYEKLCMFATSTSDVTSRDLTGTLMLLVAFGNSGRIFFVDPTDSTTANNNNTVLVDTAGNRFKVRAIAAADLTAAVVNAVLGTGGLDPNTIPHSGTDPTILGHDTDDNTWSARTVGQLVGWLDDFFGDSDWRTASDPTTAAATVVGYPSNGYDGNMKGSEFTALLFADGQVRVCGDSGPRPDSNTAATSLRYIPVPFADGVQRNIVKFWIGGTNSLFGLDDTGIIWAAGVNAHGNLGLGDTTARPHWNEITFFRNNSLTVQEIYTLSFNGTYYQCTNGQLYYSGYNGLGQAGIGNVTTPQTTPVQCGSLAGVTAVFPGSAFVDGTECVGVLAGGTFYVWGYNGQGNLGLGDVVTPRTSPVATGLTNIVKASMGYASLAMDSSGKVYGCGDNSRGLPGQGTFVGVANAWVQIVFGSPDVYTALDITQSGGRFPCGAAIVSISGAGRYLRTWGYNGSGQLGLGDGTDRNTPQTPSGTWQGSVDEAVGCDPSQAGGCGQLILRVGDRLLTCGFNTNTNLVNGTQSGATNTFGDMLGIRGEIVDFYTFCRDSICVHSVLTTEGCFNAGASSDSALGTHEGSVHNQSVFMPIMANTLAKGEDGVDMRFDAIGTAAGKSAYDSQPDGFRYVAYDDSPTAKMYQRVGTTTGVWSSGVPVFPGFAFGSAVTPTGINSTQNNYTPFSPWTASRLRQSVTGDCSITGLTGGADGRVVLLENLGPNTLTLTDADASSTAANRFEFDGDLVLPSGASVILLYDGTLSRWVSCGKSSFVAPAASAIGWNLRSMMKSSADGIIEFYNNALSSFTRLCFGGTTSSFPAIKRSSAALQIRLADDSAYANLEAALLQASAGVGYGPAGAGVGGAQTQATSKATGVTLSTYCGDITLNGAALAASTTVSFTLTNTKIEATDLLVFNHISVGTFGAYTLNAHTIAAGSCVVDVRNVSLGSLSEAIVIRFAIIKGKNT